MNRYALLAVALLVCFCTGNDTDPGWHHARSKLRYDYTVSSNSVSIDARGHQGPRKDELKIDIDVTGDDRQLRMRSEHFEKFKSARRFVKTHLRIKNIVEYEPSGDAGYDPNVDTLVNTYPENNADWSWKNVEDLNPSSDSRKVVVETTDGCLEVVFWINFGSGRFGGFVVNQDDLKFDININKQCLIDQYGWLSNSENELALVGVFQTKSRRKHCDHHQDNAETETVCGSNDELEEGGVSWIKEIVCQNRTVAVVTVQKEDDSQSQDAGEHAEVLYWSFTGISNLKETCNWDPALRTTGATSAASALGALFAMLALLLVLSL